MNPFNRIAAEPASRSALGIEEEVMKQPVKNTAINNTHAAITLTEGTDKYLQDLVLKNYSQNTIYTYGLRLNTFLEWSDERALSLAASITAEHIERYRRYLYQYCYKEKRIKAVTQKNHLLVIKQYFAWLTRSRWIVINPTADMALPKIPYQLTHRLLSQAEIKRFIDVIDLGSKTGLRDRSIIETLYSTGIRRAELINLEIDDIDIADGMVLVRLGKGNKDRRIPIGDRALHWLDRYLSDWRPDCPRASMSNTLYLSEKGYKTRDGDIGKRIREYKAKAQINKPGGCHLFRHAMATHMLDNGADIRHIQEMLGHSNLSSTQIYTKVSNQQLKDVHRQTHPAAWVESDQPEKTPES